MKVVTIQASPRATGNTATILEWVEEELKNAGHEIERIDLARDPLYDCRGCYFCQAQENYGDCKITRDAPPGEDCAKEVFDKMGAADAIVLASPLYCWSYPAHVHALFHRSISLVRGYGSPEQKTLVQGKRAALLVTCAGPVDDNADLVGPQFDRVCKFLMLEKAGELIVPECMEPAVLEDSVREKAAELAGQLAG